MIYEDYEKHISNASCRHFAVMISTKSVNYKDINVKIRLALRDLKQNDRQLLETRAHEIAITHQLACYLKQYFTPWHVDCEYNRREGGPKLNSEGQDIRPDIIIHERFDAENPSRDNLLVLEVKKNVTTASNDKEKLEELTNLEGKYQYKFGVSLCISTDSPYTAKWEMYCNGEFKKTFRE